MKRILLLGFCVGLNACSTFGPVPASSLANNAAPGAVLYGAGYPYLNVARPLGTTAFSLGGSDPYYFGLGRSTAFRYTPHYYGSHRLSHSGGITLGLGYDPLRRLNLFGGHRNSLGYGSRYRGHSLGRGIGHGRRH